MQHEAARPRRQSVEDAPSSEPMRPAVRGQLSRNPSTDQKRVRRQMKRQATQTQTQAWMLNPGDQIQTSNGQTQKVLRVRNHEHTPGTHVYVDTDQGTALVRRGDPFTLVPANTRQQTSPGYGIQGGNFNQLPWDNSLGNDSHQGGGLCPHCRQGHLSQRGNVFVCGICGYTQQQGGANGYNFGPAVPSMNTYSSINRPLISTVAARAKALLDTEENQ